MIVDLDDFSEGNHRLDLLHELKLINHLFRCTLFAVPGQGSAGFFAGLPDWLELAVHGWQHPDPYECAGWDEDRMRQLLHEAVVQDHFVRGFKAPGWQISDDCYRVLLEEGWWVADQHLEDRRRPAGLPTYFYEDGEDRWHGHIQSVCGNGLEETWGELSDRVRAAPSFRFVSETFDQHPHPDDPGTSRSPGADDRER